MTANIRMEPLNLDVMVLTSFKHPPLIRSLTRSFYAVKPKSSSGPGWKRTRLGGHGLRASPPAAQAREGVPEAAGLPSAWSRSQAPITSAELVTPP